MIGHVHQPHRLALALGPRHAEIVLEPVLGGRPLLVADDANAVAAKAAKTTDNGLVIAEFAVAGERHEIGDQGADIVEAARALGMPGDLGFLPRGERRVEVLQRLCGLGLEPPDLLAQRSRAVAGLDRAQFLNLGLDLGQRFFKVEIAAHRPQIGMNRTPPRGRAKKALMRRMKSSKHPGHEAAVLAESFAARGCAHGISTFRFPHGESDCFQLQLPRQRRRMVNSSEAEIEGAVDPTILTDLVLANRILYRLGVLDSHGHVSVRDPKRPDHFFLARSLAPALVSAADIMAFDLDSSPVEPRRRALYSERFIHGEIYRVRSDVNAVVHSHTPTVIPFSISKTALRPVCHMASFMPQAVPVFEIRQTAGMT